MDVMPMWLIARGMTAGLSEMIPLQTPLDLLSVLEKVALVSSEEWVWMNWWPGTMSYNLRKYGNCLSKAELCIQYHRIVYEICVGDNASTKRRYLAVFHPTCSASHKLNWNNWCSKHPVLTWTPDRNNSCSNHSFIAWLSWKTHLVSSVQ